MATIGAIRTGLKTRLETIAGWTVYDAWPEQPVTPAAWVHYIGPVDGPYATLGGNAYDEFEVLVAVTRGAGLAEAQDALDAYVSRSGAQSVQAAIEGDQTLGGTVDFALFAGWVEYGETVEVNGVEYAGARARVRVWH